jgi:predicted glycoside hydrolase/deacetylase ChbG (UPF0249 family)
MTKRIVLCADDYGQAPEISKGIIYLIQHGRLTATSCMVNTPCWPEHAGWLAPYLTQIDLGLHFNLTEGLATSKVYQDTHGQAFMPLTRLLVRSMLRNINQKAIQAELNAQIDLFQEATGMLPRYIDGHHHVHQFPVIRDALVHVYEKRLRKHGSYIRLVNEPLRWSDFVFDFKKLIIVGSGTVGLERMLNQKHIPHNSSFSGIYSFQKSQDYSQVFVTFLRKVGSGGIVMCHPGLPSTNPTDSIAAARYKEYKYLASGQFLEDCIDQGVKLTRFS